ncbi:hypothetical protein ACWD26_33745 [Streptomyces sp. NPDC002787]
MVGLVGTILGVSEGSTERRRPRATERRTREAAPREERRTDEPRRKRRKAVTDEGDAGGEDRG